MGKSNRAGRWTCWLSLVDDTVHFGRWGDDGSLRECGPGRIVEALNRARGESGAVEPTLAAKSAWIAELVYEAARLEARWSGRRTVPEEWQDRDERFRQQMIRTVTNYLAMNQLPSPEEAHNSWVREYIRAGWKFSEKPDPELQLRPELVPYGELSKDERDKDAVFLALVWLAKQLARFLGGERTSTVEKHNHELEWDPIRGRFAHE